MGSLEETKSWLMFAKDCNYISDDIYNDLCSKYDDIGAKLFKLYENWKNF